jgi:hypothetical protein
MDDRLRDQLATLGQKLEYAAYERQLALDEVRSLVSKHHAEVSLSQVAELTTVPKPTLTAMLREEAPEHDG